MKIADPTSNFLAIDAEFSSIENSAIAIVSAPYEHTVSYGGGAKKGPKAIIDASAYVEFYDDEFDRELCYDKGICTLSPIEFGKKVDRPALDVIQDQVNDLIEMEKFVVTLGG